MHLQATHPDLNALRAEDANLEAEAMGAPEGSSMDPWLKKWVCLKFTREASIYSIIIESMPNLVYLEATEEVISQFTKVDVRRDDGIPFSLPLLGLSSLKTLRM